MKLHWSTKAQGSVLYGSARVGDQECPHGYTYRIDLLDPAVLRIGYGSTDRLCSRHVLLGKGLADTIQLCQDHFDAHMRDGPQVHAEAEFALDAPSILDGKWLDGDYLLPSRPEVTYSGYAFPSSPGMQRARPYSPAPHIRPSTSTMLKRSVFLDLLFKYQQGRLTSECPIVEAAMRLDPKSMPLDRLPALMDLVRKSSYLYDTDRREELYTRAVLFSGDYAQYASAHELTYGSP